MERRTKEQKVNGGVQWFSGHVDGCGHDCGLGIGQKWRFALQILLEVKAISFF